MKRRGRWKSNNGMAKDKQLYNNNETTFNKCSAAKAEDNNS
jgi:hypothetical protein